DATRAVYRQLVAGQAPFLRAAGAANLARAGDRAQLPLLAKALLAMPEDERPQALNLLHGLGDAEVADAVRSYLRAGASASLVTAALQRRRQLEKGATAPTRAAADALRGSADAGVRAAALAFLAAAGDDTSAKDLAALIGA